MAFTVFLWLSATAGHFWLTARAARVLLSADRATLDDRIFAAVLGGVASLSLVLHTIALAVGLNLWSGLAGLAVWNVGLWVVSARRSAAQPADLSQVSATLADRAALAILFAVLITWVTVAAATGDLHGPDAAHYHVPTAVNIARGDSPFDLPATPHLYPLAGSVVAAWFIVPFGDPLIVDLAMALPFALLLAALSVAFRATTGLSGTAWATWLGLALFSTPMFRSASAGSADLWFAAGFVSVAALVMRAWSRPGFRDADLWLLGGAAGILIGSKTTGVVAAGLIALAAAAIGLIRRMVAAPKSTDARTSLRTMAGASLVLIGAGGIWLIRNWVQFGSPLAPTGLTVFGLTVFEGGAPAATTYFSVLGEMQDSAFELGRRSAFYVSRWFGPGFLPAMGLIGLLLVDLVVTFRRRLADARWWPRAGGLLLTVSAGAALIWILLGAPWTALERSGGLTLRYALPIPALLALFAFASMFPLRWPWYARPGVRVVAQALLIAGSCWLFWRSAPANGVGPSALPAISLGGLAAATLIVFTGRLRVAAWALRIGLVVLLAITMSTSDTEVRFRASEALETEEAAFAAGQQPASEWRALFLAVRGDERVRGRTCVARRFYSLVRNDEPMALQPPEYTSRIYYAGREVEAARNAGPIGVCDYIVTTRAMEDTGKGQQLVEALAGGQPVEATQATANFILYKRMPLR